MYNPFYERAVSAVNVSVISPREVVSGYVNGAPQLGRLPLHVSSRCIVVNTGMHRGGPFASAPADYAPHRITSQHAVSGAT